MEKGRRCVICSIDVHRASLAIYLRKTRHKENGIERDKHFAINFFLNPMKLTKPNPKWL